MPLALFFIPKRRETTNFQVLSIQTFWISKTLPIFNKNITELLEINLYPDPATHLRMFLLICTLLLALLYVGCLSTPILPPRQLSPDVSAVHTPKAHSFVNISAYKQLAKVWTSAREHHTGTTSRTTSVIWRKLRPMSLR